MRTPAVLAYTLFLTSKLVRGAQYNLVRDYSGTGFFDGWVYESDPSGSETHGELRNEYLCLLYINSPGFL